MSGALDRMLARRPQRGWGVVSLLVIAVLAGAVGWASFARLDEVAVAQGEVVPQGQTKVVQHLTNATTEEESLELVVVNRIIKNPTGNVMKFLFLPHISYINQ